VSWLGLVVCLPQQHIDNYLTVTLLAIGG